MLSLCGEQSTHARSRTQAEWAAVGRGREAASDQSPYAQATRGESVEEEVRIVSLVLGILIKTRIGRS